MFMMTTLIHRLAVSCQLKQRQCQADTPTARPVEAVKYFYGLPRVSIIPVGKNVSFFSF
jgi:hypothetical protein